MIPRVKHQTVVIAAILHCRQANLPQVAGTSCLSCFLPCMGKYRVQKRHENAEDGEDNQQFGERKAGFSERVHSLSTNSDGKTVRSKGFFFLDFPACAIITYARHGTALSLVCFFGCPGAGGGESAALCAV